MTVAAILKNKGHEVTSVEPTTSIADVAKMLSARRIGAAIVLDAADRLIGIVSERDIVHALAAHGSDALAMSVERVMTRAVKTASPATSVAQAMGIMSEGRFRHLPVMADGVLIGIVSIGDIVKARIMQQEQEVDSLKAYVAGSV